MKFELEDYHRGLSDEDLLSELRHCASMLKRSTITMSEYEKIGKVRPSTFQRRFGSWVKALELAQLKPSRSKIGITEDELMENIRFIWENLGRQPTYSEIKAPFSKFSVGTYEKRFGSWRKSLIKFIEWVSVQESYNPEYTKKKNSPLVEAAAPQVKRKSRREISDRQRFRILVRDGFRCKSCGISPLEQYGTQLHVDHIIPWSKGGETVDENLETKCAQCNLEKGNAFNV